MSFTTHLSILEGMKDDNQISWERFYKMYAPLIRLHGRDCGIQPDYMEDLIQNVMISLARQIQSFTYRRELGRFRDFIRKIIRARAMDILRTMYRDELVLPDLCVMDEAVLDEHFEQEWREHVQRVSLELLKRSVSAKHYQIFDLLEIRQVKVKEVARFYHLPESTIYSIRNRTEEKLRAIVREQDF